MGNEVNEVINNICDKLGYAASEITPEMAKYMIAKDTFAVLASALVCAICVAVAIKMIKVIRKHKEDDPWSDDALEAIICGGCIFVALFSVIMMLTDGADLVGWIVSPKASMVEYVLNAIK